MKNLIKLLQNGEVLNWYLNSKIICQAMLLNMWKSRISDCKHFFTYVKLIKTVLPPICWQIFVIMKMQRIGDSGLEPAWFVFESKSNQPMIRKWVNHDSPTLVPLIFIDESISNRIKVNHFDSFASKVNQNDLDSKIKWFAEVNQKSQKDFDSRGESKSFFDFWFILANHFIFDSDSFWFTFEANESQWSVLIHFDFPYWFDLIQQKIISNGLILTLIMK